MAPNTLDFTKVHTVKLLVGETRNPFEISSNIVLRSTILRKRLETYHGNNFTMYVSETTPELMRLYLGFIHTGPHQVNLPDKKGTTISKKYAELANVYVVSMRLDDMGARNDVVTAMMKLSKIKDTEGQTWAPGPEAIQLLYSNTFAGSPIRRLATDLWVPIKPFQVQLCKGKNLPRDFLKDVIDTTKRQAEPIPDGLLKIIWNLMGIEEVEKLPNVAATKGSDFYMES